MPTSNDEKAINITSFLKQLTSSHLKYNSNNYFRGQSDANYTLLPSILRKGREDFEHEIYTQIMTECSSEFDGIVSHGEILSKMQHYGVPTRLLDITSNPLVALYFACDQNSDADGKVYIFDVKPEILKVFDSDTISILSCLPRFNNQEKNEIKRLAQDHINEQDIFNDKIIIKRLLHEIKKEKPSFENMINPYDLLKEYFYIPKKNNARIIRQNGAFILYGLRDIISDNENGEYPDYIKNEILIDGICKPTILKQLSTLGISKATLYPELYKVAEFINEKYMR